MKTLLLDIETTPNIAYTFDLWRTTIAPVKIIEVSRVLCFSAKWLDAPRKTMEFYSAFNAASSTVSYADQADRVEMLDNAHRLLDEADCVIHYNGHAFDIPYLNREFLLEGYLPPSPIKQIDLLQTVRKVFQFPSNQLAHVSKELGLPGKVEHEGFALWIKCMNGDVKAQKLMEKYNKQDVYMLEDLYHYLQPWIISHPSHAAFTGDFVCPACGSSDLMKRGYAYTAVSKFQQYCCQDCGKYSRDTRRVSGAKIAGVTQ